MFQSDQSDAVRRMYSSENALRTRQDIHDQFSLPAIDYPQWALSNVSWRGDERVLDVGCGPGRWFAPLIESLPAVEYTGVDLFPVMVVGHPQHDRLVQADAAYLPFAAQQFDVVMANHMLFHVDDPEKAVVECARVLKPDGFLMATTNSVTTMPQLQTLIRRAITLLMPPGATAMHIPAHHTDNFTLESGTRLLARHFYAVVRYDLPGTLVFPAVEPVIAYLESTRMVRETELPTGVNWDDVMLIVREQVNRVIDHFGQLEVQKLSGLLVATNSGDFISEYLACQSRYEDNEKTQPSRPRP